MKNLLSALAITGLLSGSAFAMQPSHSVFGVVGASSQSVEYRLDSGTATLTGDVETLGESSIIEAYVKNLEGVDRVINLILVN